MYCLQRLAVFSFFFVFFLGHAQGFWVYKFLSVNCCNCSHATGGLLKKYMPRSRSVSLHFLHGLRASNLLLESLIHLNFKRVWDRDVVFSICRYSIFPNIFDQRGYLFSNMSLLFLCQRWDSCICVCLYLDPLFDSVDLDGYFVLVPRCFYYYSYVVYLKSNTSSTLLSEQLWLFRGFCFSIWVLLFFLIIWRKKLEFWWDFYWICICLLTV